MRLAPNNFTAFAKCMTVPATLTPADICILASHYSHMGGAVAVWVARWLFGWRGGCVGSVSARSLQTEPTARLWVRVRSTDVYRVISLGKIFTPTRLG